MRIDSIVNFKREKIYFWRVDVKIRFEMGDAGSNIFLFFRVEFVEIDIGDKFSNWRSN